MSKRFFVVFLALVMIAQVGVLTGCSGPSSNPAKTAEAFYEALQKKDAEKAVTFFDPAAVEEEADAMDMTAKEFRADLVKELKDLFDYMGEIKSFSVGETEVDGNEAWVDITVDYEEWGEDEFSLELIKRGGKWYIQP